MVTENLENALRHVRLPDKTITLWVDALCINQSDELEKSEQVGQMHEIYSRAASVLAWLGPAAGYSDIAMAWIAEFGARSVELGIGTKPNLRLRYLCQADEKDFSSSEGAVKQFIKDLKAQLSPTHPQYSKVISALSDFFKRDYWGRIWVVQELSTTAKTLFVCGEKIVTENELHYGLRVLRNFRHYRLLTSSHDAQLRPYDESIISIDTRNAIELLKVRRAARPVPLIRLLRSLRQDKATDPRDKVFALVGIAEDRQVLNLRPNYSKSCAEVYINTAHTLFQAGYIEILSLCESLQRIPELPSWVPDWSRETYRCPLQRRTLNRDTNYPTTLLQPRFSASGTHNFIIGQASGCNEGDNKTLSLSGTFVGEVQSVGAIWEHEGVTRWLCDLNNLSQLSSRAVEGSKQAQVTWRTAVADQEIWHGTEKPRLSESTIRKVHEFLTNRDLGHLDSQTFTEAGLGDYNQQLQEIARGRRPMLASGGYIGIVPSETKPGDSVFVISNADVPYIFRQQPQGNMLQLIGDAYVHGIMDGEALEGSALIQTIKIG
ncbi:hypothetical protein VE01_08081 [Pseudogymnoascus verrucosus]|uniref:Heterokaryon incompatibility domain-containing protein n=1 Tax=Pseudogymnoascus verrucosus TaxID=342668 RepID=A0A1B8GCQ2_9PEZI|nr:uncharacterized protein VE01_08081 [Pseudogymnoascus verrucosus]OBT93614.2 hypothetical protein VE01_08081 [Pseudogymnoascus verrucosus]